MVVVQGILLFDLYQGPNVFYTPPIGMMPLRVMVSVPASPFIWTDPVEVISPPDPLAPDWVPPADPPDVSPPPVPLPDPLPPIPPPPPDPPDTPPVEVPHVSGHWRIVVKVNGNVIGKLVVDPNVDTLATLVPITQTTCLAGQLFEIFYEVEDGSPIAIQGVTAVVWWKAVFY